MRRSPEPCIGRSPGKPPSVRGPAVPLTDGLSDTQTDGGGGWWGGSTVAEVRGTHSDWVRSANRLILIFLVFLFFRFFFFFPFHIFYFNLILFFKLIFNLQGGRENKVAVYRRTSGRNGRPVAAVTTKKGVGPIGGGLRRDRYGNNLISSVTYPGFRVPEERI